MEKKRLSFLFDKTVYNVLIIKEKNHDTYKQQART